MAHPYKTREGGATVTVFVPYDCQNNCPFCINKKEYADCSGFSLEKIIENRGLQDVIFDVRIPVETMIEKDGDQEKVVETKIFPSYVFVKMVMSDETWHAVRNITGVTGFVGPGSRPSPLSDAEVEALNIEDEDTKIKLSFNVGDNVDVVNGLFEGYSGVVTAISDDLKNVTVLVKKGRRDMPVELETSMIRRAQN